MRKTIKVEEEKTYCDICGAEAYSRSVETADYSNKGPQLDLCSKHEPVVDIARLLIKMVGQFGESEMDMVREILDEIVEEQKQVEEKPIIELIAKKLKEREKPKGEDKN